jgi:multisubunit Na+/H+ antiporter MnhB subunit
MNTLLLDVPDFGFIVGTRVALAAGIGLLAANNLPEERRRAIGTALVAVGVITTIPAVMSVMRGLRRSRRAGAETGIGFDERLIGATRFPRKGDDYSS